MTENLLILGCNILILGLNLKLYTEYFKDKAQDKRAANKNTQHSTSRGQTSDE
jgi:hypothetical protein